MAVTPEGKIKKLVQKVLDEFEDYTPTGAGLYRYWPVPSGFGASSLDCIVCYRGRFIGIETKAPGKKPTPRQGLTIIQMRSADAIVLVIDDEKGVHELRVVLQGLKDAADNR